MVRRVAIVLGLLAAGAALLHCVGNDPEPASASSSRDAGPGVDGTAGGDAATLPEDASGPEEDGGTDAALTWDGNFGPAPPSSGSYYWQRILKDGTNTSYSPTAVSAGWYGDVVVAARLDNAAMSTFGSPALSGPGFAVVKVSADNTKVLWRQKFSGSVPVRVGRVLVDEKDDIYVTGNVDAGQSAAIGAATITGGHGFVAKLRGTDGQLEWVHQIGGTTSSAFSLATKPGRPIVLAGRFKGTLSYPRAAGGSLSNSGDATRSSAFVMTLDRSTGNAIWGRSFLSSSSTSPGVDADMATTGNVEMALLMAGTVTSDTAATVATLPDTSVVLATLAEVDGAYSAVAHYRTTLMYDVAVRALPGGGAVCAGEAATTTTIPSYQPSSTSQDMWIMGTNAAHASQWTHWFRGKYAGQAQDDREYLSCLDVDHWGRILVGMTSYSAGGLALDGVDVFGARTDGANTGYMAMAKFTESGATVWAKAIHTGATAEVEAVDCRFGLNGDTVFSAELTASAAPDFGGGAVTAPGSRAAAVVRWTP